MSKHTFDVFHGNSVKKQCKNGREQFIDLPIDLTVNLFVKKNKSFDYDKRH